MKGQIGARLLPALREWWRWMGKGAGTVAAIWFLPLPSRRVDFGLKTGTQALPGNNVRPRADEEPDSLSQKQHGREGAGCVCYGAQVGGLALCVILCFSHRKWSQSLCQLISHSSSSVSAWELVTNADSQVPPQTCWVRTSESVAQKAVGTGFSGFWWLLSFWALVYTTWLSGGLSERKVGRTLTHCRTSWIYQPLVNEFKYPGLDELHPKISMRLQMRSLKCRQLAKYILKRATWILSSLTRWTGCRRKS